MENIREDLKKIYLKYGKIRTEMSNIQEELQILEAKRTYLEDDQTKTRDTEKELINKLEGVLNRKVTQEDLIKIISDK